jgi:hypothetical protein
MAQLSSAPPRERISSPWSERLFDAAPLSPAWVGGGITLGLLALTFVLELAFGELRPFLRGETTVVGAEEYRFTLVFALMIGYLPASYAYAVRGSRRTWEALRPVLRCTSVEFETLRDTAGRFSAADQRRAGFIGVVIAFLVPFLVDFSLSVYQLQLERIHFTPTLHRVLLPIVGWLLGRNVHAMLTDSARLARVGREQLDVDLLDLEPLSPFTRHGLRNALLFMGSLAILALLAVDWGTRPGLPLLISSSFLLSIVLGIVTLLLPVRGAHASIRDCKREELDACNAAIRVRRRAQANFDDVGTGLQELLAWRSFVESVREWPFDASTFTRFLLYLAIPLGSWLGGAMVERVVDAALE